MQFDSDGNPKVFNVERNEDGSWLNNNWAKPDNRWNADNQFVFRLRKCLFPSHSAKASWDGFFVQGFPGFSSTRQAFFQFHRVSLQRPHIAYWR